MIGQFAVGISISQSFVEWQTVY